MKSLVVSKIVHVLSSIFSGIVKGTESKDKHDQWLYNKGGLKMIDIESFSKSLMKMKSGYKALNEDNHGKVKGSFL